jgi:hypothetical protein
MVSRLVVNLSYQSISGWFGGLCKVLGIIMSQADERQHVADQRDEIPCLYFCFIKRESLSENLEPSEYLYREHSHGVCTFTMDTAPPFRFELLVVAHGLPTMV